MEIWSPIDNFPPYEVSNQGRVRNGESDKLLGIHDNGHGILQVVMRRDGRNNARAVHRLVANAFLDAPPEDDEFVPMWIDGDRTNNQESNLQWKPRWFAIKITLQNKRTKPKDGRRIRHVKSGTVYVNALEAAKELEGLEELIILTAQAGHGRTYLGTTWELLGY